MKFVLTIFLFYCSTRIHFWQSNLSCPFENRTLEIAMTALITRGLVSDNKDTLLLRVNFATPQLTPSESWNIKGKTILIQPPHANGRRNDIILEAYSVAETSKTIDVSFRTITGGGGSYSGSIALECQAGHTTFKEIFFVYSISCFRRPN